MINGVPCKIHPNKPKDDGYVQVGHNGRLVYAHRLALETKLGRPLLFNMESLHICGVRNCHEWEHLREGTHLENMRDRDTHGTTARGNRNGKHLHPETCTPCKGVENGSAKLTDTEVLLIRKLYATGDWPQTFLALWFGVSQRTIWSIVKRKTWRHL